MYLSEYLIRKEKAERIKLPMYWPKEKNIFHIIRFLKEEERMAYPDEWFLENTPRTLGIYKQRYTNYWKRFIQQMKEYEVAKKELTHLAYLVKIGAVEETNPTLDTWTAF